MFSGSQMTPGLRKYLHVGFNGLAPAWAWWSGRPSAFWSCRPRTITSTRRPTIQAQLDSIQQRGQHDADIADVGWVVAGVARRGRS